MNTMITGNKGEWSEIYTFLKLLADGKLYAADANLEKIDEVFYPIIKILRKELLSSYEYYAGSEVKIVNGETEDILASIPVQEFITNASKLLQIIKSSESVFSAPSIEDFMLKIRSNTFKAKSTDKGDITLVLHDLKTGLEPKVSFSIKSLLGQPSTLLNPGRTTNFIYKISGDIDDKVMESFNSEEMTFKQRLEFLNKSNCDLEFEGLENPVFHSNLTIIDSSLPEILANLVLNFYKGKSSRISNLTELVEDENPLNYSITKDHKFYTYKIKALLRDIALGMTPAKVWSGKFDATGGYIIVREDGEVVCYHIYNMNEFQEYLFSNTKLDTPSKSRYGFGDIYFADGSYKLKLNLQIRFVK